MKNRNIRIATKIRVLKTHVWSVLLYGCECWTISNYIQMKLGAAEMWFLRRILNISWTEKRTNQNVLEMANIERSLMKAIKTRQGDLQFSRLGIIVIPHGLVCFEIRGGGVFCVFFIDPSFVFVGCFKNKNKFSIFFLPS